MFHAQCRAQCRTRSHGPGIMTLAESRVGHPTNGAIQACCVWVRRIDAEAITQSNFQHLLHEDLEAVDLLVGWHHPEPLEVLLGVLLLWQALHIGHPVQSQVVGILQVARDGGEITVGAIEELGAKELEEEARRTEDVGIEDLHTGGREAIDLRCLPHSEVDCLHTLVQGDIEHGILLSLGELHLLLLQCLNQGLHLVEVGLPSEQAHLLEVLRLTMGHSALWTLTPLVGLSSSCNN
uniref:Uncharacterized protein n=1 Tax=Felis catus TaxID=9685 RepID=A0ABI8AFC3_FELCA